MARSRPEFGLGAPATGMSLATAGRLATRTGAVLTLMGAPLALATFLTVLLGAPSLGAGLDAAVSATSGPLAAGGGVGWLLHVAILGVLAGCWILGAGLVLSGLTD